MTEWQEDPKNITVLMSTGTQTDMEEYVIACIVCKEIAIFTSYTAYRKARRIAYCSEECVHKAMGNMLIGETYDLNKYK